MSGPSRPEPAVVALGGLAVLLVVAQGTGAVPVELLGTDLLLAVAGFQVTVLLLGGPDRPGLPAWLGAQLRLRLPLLVLTAAAVVAVTAVTASAPRAADTAAAAVAGLAGAGNWWDLATTDPAWGAVVDRIGIGAAGPVESHLRVDPLGSAWLVGLLVQLGVAWSLLLTALRWLLGPGRLLPAVVAGLALAAAAVAPLRAAAGADLAELALGTHTRAAEWLLGAAAAALVTAGRQRAPAGPAATARSGTALRGTALAVSAGVLLAASAAAATLWPEQWLRLAGPAGAALGAAVLLVAVHSPVDGPLPRALGRGLPLELGRVAYPLLLLHLPVFWLVQLAAPAARPFALLVLGAALAWLLGLVLQDGVVRRAARRRVAVPAVVAVLVAATVAGGIALHGAAGRPVGTGPTVLVLGGAGAGELAAALAAAGGTGVVDASRPGCGLLPPAPRPAPAAAGRPAQLPAAPAPACGDWTRQWSSRIAATAPAAIVVDLGVDAVTPPGGPGPCDAAFRPAYRALLDRAVAVWTAGAPRPVLVADGPPGTREGRCLDALLVEAVAAHRALVPLEVSRLRCPADASAVCDGSAAIALDGAQRATLGGAVGAAVTAVTGPGAAGRGRDCVPGVPGVGEGRC